MLLQLEKTLSEIKSTLLNDEIVRKLLFNDSNNCLNDEYIPTIIETTDYITLYPIYQFQNKECYEKNGMVNIVIPTINTEDNTNVISGVIQINVVFNVDKWMLVNNKIRPIELSNRIIKLLNNKKFSISNPLEFNVINDLIINKTVVGYALLFDFQDGNSEVKNF